MRGILIDFQDGNEPFCGKSKINARDEEELAKIVESNW